MHSEWLTWLIDKFITEETYIRCCGSCMGGCVNPAICFLCCGYNQEHLNNYINQKGRAALIAEFDAFIAAREQEYYDEIFCSK